MNKRPSVVVAGVAAVWLILSASVAGQTAEVVGTVRDETGHVLPGVSVDVRDEQGAARETITDASGAYRFDSLGLGPLQLSFALINFSAVRRDVVVAAAGSLRIDIVLRVALNADVTVTGGGITQSASQGAIAAQQLGRRPLMRTGEVLETVPGVVISQHSGEGKANQYYLRGFNLDHGTDFATTVAGVPVNMPTHGHGQGYSDVNFLIPELVSGVQYSKGPYFAERGDFATAGAADIGYVSVLTRPFFRVSGGDEGFARAVAALSPKAGTGHVLAAMEAEHNDGPWLRPDDYRRVNAVLRYSRSDTVNGFSLTGMAHRSTWNATDQVPLRAIEQGIVDRFGALDPTDGGDTSRYSVSLDWQRARNNATIKATAYGVGSELNLFSNFTFFLDDPVHGDQFHQVDRRFVTGGSVSYRRINQWASRHMQTTLGMQVRNDDIANVGLFHTQARRLLDTIRQDGVLQTSGSVYG